MTSISERVRTLLESLGDTPDEVAESLRTKGIKGYRDDGCNCPIANLISTAVPEATHWDAEDGWFVEEVEVRWPDAPGTFDTVTPPNAVKRFIDGFDGGAYPFLDYAHEEDES